MDTNPPRTKLHRLISLPFTPFETDLFVGHLKSIEKQDPFAKDVLLMWNIQNARFTEARDIMKDDGHEHDKRRVIWEGLEKANVSM